MLAANSKTVAQVLMELLRHNKSQPKPDDQAVDKAISDFLFEIESLDTKHNQKGKEKKPINEDHLAQQVFRRTPTFKNEKELIPYFRCQLRAALEQLKLLVKDMKDRNNGSITLDTLLIYKYLIIDYIFDLREILNTLQKNETDWKFFDGGKNSDVTSWQVYGLANSLALQSTFSLTENTFEHKTAQIASIFILRQALELRFERLISVYPIDKNGKPPKLRHGFHFNFIIKNPKYFQFDGFKIDTLQHVYDWCSEIVHRVYQPYTWQISFALRLCNQLLNPRSSKHGQDWSIFNSTKIVDVEEMQSTFENHFLACYEHGEWRFARKKPEASVKDWKDQMASNSEVYRKVLYRRSFSKSIKKMINRLFCK